MANKRQQARKQCCPKYVVAIRGAILLIDPLRKSLDTEHDNGASSQQDINNGQDTNKHGGKAV